jgi:hypothetical protein
VEPQLAIVGSRNPTAQGRETALGFAEYLGERGLSITSGVAEGIDAYAHQAGATCPSTGISSGTVHWSANLPRDHRRGARIFRNATASSRACAWGPWWSKRPAAAAL